MGQKLKVAAPAKTQEKAPAEVKTSASGNYTIYVVKDGDSFYSIAKNYPGVSADNIMDFNGLSSSKIKPGMTIKIPQK